MKITFTGLSKPSKNITGSSLSGYVKTNRKYLEMLFGPPLEPGPDDKTIYEWHVDVHHDEEYAGTVAIYDYKSDHSEDPDEDIHWHLGSKSKYHAMEVEDFILTGQKHIQ